MHYLQTPEQERFDLKFCALLWDGPLYDKVSEVHSGAGRLLMIRHLAGRMTWPLMRRI